MAAESGCHLSGVSGTSNKFKSFGFASRSLLVAAQGRDWRCVNFWKLWLPPPFEDGGSVALEAIIDAVEHSLGRDRAGELARIWKSVLEGENLAA